MKICTIKSTGELIVAQSHSTHESMISDAIINGYDENDIEVKEVTEQELDQILLKIDEEALTYQDRRRAEYPSIDEVTVALTEKEEGDSTMWDEVTAKRQTVRLKYPKI
jgi:hypothetical protein